MSKKKTDKPIPAMAQSACDIRRHVAMARTDGKSIAFVPTMGALHAGHLSLIHAAVESGAFTVVSIYVNPTQFGPQEDLNVYPRTPEEDHAACCRAGVDLIFAPSDTEMYPPGDQTRVRPGPLAEPLCGRFRPGHFEGVCTVVAKLFNMVQPDVAYFGQKDAQQALVICRMVRDLAMPIRIEVCPIVRESDGLALSSRNRRLSHAQRTQAICLYQSLCAGRDRLLGGEQSIERACQAMQDALHRGAAVGDDPVETDYLAIVDAATLETATVARGRLLLAGAVRIAGIRLIDNLVVDLAKDLG